MNTHKLLKKIAELIFGEEAPLFAGPEARKHLNQSSSVEWVRPQAVREPRKRKSTFF